MRRNCNEKKMLCVLYILRTPAAIPMYVGMLCNLAFKQCYGYTSANCNFPCLL